MELNRLEGRGNHKTFPCGRCGTIDPAYRCRDCDGSELFCKACTVHGHRVNFLHRIQVRRIEITQKSDESRLTLYPS